MKVNFFFTAFGLIFGLGLKVTAGRVAWRVTDGYGRVQWEGEVEGPGHRELTLPLADPLPPNRFAGMLE